MSEENLSKECKESFNELLKKLHPPLNVKKDAELINLLKYTYFNGARFGLRVCENNIRKAQIGKD